MDDFNETFLLNAIDLVMKQMNSSPPQVPDSKMDSNDLDSRYDFQLGRLAEHVAHNASDPDYRLRLDVLCRMALLFGVARPCLSRCSMRRRRCRRQGPE